MTMQRRKREEMMAMILLHEERGRILVMTTVMILKRMEIMMDPLGEIGEGVQAVEMIETREGGEIDQETERLKDPW